MLHSSSQALDVIERIVKDDTPLILFSAFTISCSQAVHMHLGNVNTISKYMLTVKTME